MAKRYSSKKGRKVEPAELMFMYETTAGPALEAKYIDLSQSASLLNRRFYRQGINWVVSHIEILNVEPVPAGPAAQIAIGKLPNTWVMGNSWEKGFRTWQKMNQNALAEAPSVKPKFLDFKIYADQEHCNAGFGANLLPRAYALGTTATSGEWIPSKVIVPNTALPAGVQNFEIKAVGTNYGSGSASGLAAVSLIEGYAASRGLPYQTDPNTPADTADASGATPENWMSALFNEGTSQDDQVLTDMIFENNEAPYPFEGDGTHTDTMYPGGANQLSGLAMHDVEQVSNTTIGGTTRFKGGNFPCGLIKLGTFGFAENTNVIVKVHLVPGNHRGYLCESMTEM